MHRLHTKRHTEATNCVAGNTPRPDAKVDNIDITFSPANSASSHMAQRKLLSGGAGFSILTQINTLPVSQANNI
jgi:hypothetical protein